MWYRAKITAPAAAAPISLEEAKAQCRVDFNDDDELIDRLIDAACDHVERYCGVRFAQQTVEIRCDGFCDLDRLPEGPVQSITSIAYIDEAGATQTLDASVYELQPDGLEASIVLKRGQRWPAVQSGSSVTVTLVVGYAKAPPGVRQAMMLLIAAWYENREQVLVGVSVANLPFTAAVDGLLCNHRRGA